MNKIEFLTIPITTTGGAGAASGSATTVPIHGFLLDVFLDYNTAAPATTDVTISDPVFGNIVVKSNNATDCKLAPREKTQDVAAADTTFFDLIPLNGAITISVAQADALANCVIVTLRWLRP